MGRVFDRAGHFFGGFELGLVGGEVFLVEVGEDVDLLRGAGAEEGAVEAVGDLFLKVFAVGGHEFGQRLGGFDEGDVVEGHE